MRTRGILAALVGALVLAVVTAGASASPGATAAAKKKCSKRHGAKRKCRKQRKRRADDPRLPVIRANLTWFNGGSNDMDVSLFVFDAQGESAGAGSNAIPLSSLSGDVTGEAGSETFTDGLFTPQAVRDLSFGVCLSGPGAADADFTLTYVTADGVVHGDSQSPATSSHYDYPGGAPIPSGYCP
jgi:hypothetical protein